MTQAESVSLADSIVTKLEEALIKAKADKVKYGRILLREDVENLYSLVAKWRTGRE